MTFPFAYPTAPHIRRHGPQGYADYASYRPWLRDEFSFRCVYCLLREQWALVRGTFTIDHFLPVAIHPDRTAVYDNLVYSCAACNMAKREKVLPDPCQVLVSDDVRVLNDGAILATTPAAQRLVEVLGLDSPEYREFRLAWIDIITVAAERRPELLQRLMGYPANLPELKRLRPPGGNSRPGGGE